MYCSRQDRKEFSSTHSNPHVNQSPMPRFSAMTGWETPLLGHTDLSVVGCSETRIIAVIPAIANTVCHVTGTRMHTRPLRMPEAG